MTRRSSKLARWRLRIRESGWFLLYSTTAPRDSPTALFVSSRSGELTYGELRNTAQRFARSLQELGVAPGDRVATMLYSSIEYVTCWFGIVWAGAVDVPVNTEYKGTFLEHVLRDSAANVLVIDGSWIDRLDGMSIPDLAYIVVVGDPAAASPVAIHRLPELLTADPAPLMRRDPHDLVYIMYTSGTTGPSKGVMHTNRSSLWYIQPFLRQLGWREGDVVYANFPLFHQMGRSTMTTAAMWQGERVVLRPVFSVSDFWKDVRDIGATIFGFLGSIILMLDSQPERADDADNPLRVGFGAAAPPDLMEEFEQRFGVTLLENYGSTECGVPAHAMPGDIKVGTMGRPTWYMDVEIHDDQDKPVPTARVGLMWRHCSSSVSRPFPALPCRASSESWRRYPRRLHSGCRSSCFAPKASRTTPRIGRHSARNIDARAPRSVCCA
jgi:crotonobetaine/carnitine-CoA ligase